MVEKSTEAEETDQENVFDDMSISAEDVGTDVDDMDGSVAAKKGEDLGLVFAVGDRAYSYYTFL